MDPQAMHGAFHVAKPEKTTAVTVLVQFLSYFEQRADVNRQATHE
jgi:hypothetical protein